MLNRLSAPVTAAFLAFGLPASAELNPGHQVDEGVDIIVGEADAAHELIVLSRAAQNWSIRAA
ncbi:hypothetical protein [Pseudooceanicola sp.]|uniref:hypothetical protein n=1 Tax=Pseudooceanicola sp. TaxID=1914328 RepID=UPI00261ECCFB|nr:hypothetical protein [Pseudooceanicola sp.]MDF1856276.1 hypothetical protein [Pseudooceanicola sp.]